MPFLAVDEITGEFEANGILGLGPSNDKRSYVNQLYYQGQIDEQVVGLNFENPEDKSSASTVTFGYLDYTQVFGGEDGLNWYENIGVDHWAVLMSDVLYGEKDIQGSVGGKMALIDSGNRSIQMPDSEFKQLKRLMLKQDRSIKAREIEGNEILVSSLSCDALAKRLNDLEFMLHHTKIKIKPKGYLYSLTGQKDCFIGV